MRTRTLSWPLVLLTLVLATPRCAAQAEQKVPASYKAACKQALKDFKQALQDATANLAEDITVFKLRFDDLVASDEPVQDLADALEQYQVAARTAQQQASTAIGVAAGQVTSALGEGDADVSVFPLGLVVGDGGVLDDSMAAVHQAAAKAIAAVNKKLDKVAKQLRSKTDMRLTVALRQQGDFVPIPSASGFSLGEEAGFTIDLLLGFDRGGADDDGRFWVGGVGASYYGQVEVHVVGADFASVDADVDDGNSRWRVANEAPAGDSLKEGNYDVVAFQPAGAAISDSLGIP